MARPPKPYPTYPGRFPNSELPGGTLIPNRLSPRRDPGPKRKPRTPGSPPPPPHAQSLGGRPLAAPRRSGRPGPGFWFRFGRGTAHPSSRGGAWVPPRSGTSIRAGRAVHTYLHCPTREPAAALPAQALLPRPSRPPRPSLFCPLRRRWPSAAPEVLAQPPAANRPPHPFPGSESRRKYSPLAHLVRWVLCRVLSLHKFPCDNKSNVTHVPGVLTSFIFMIKLPTYPINFVPILYTNRNTGTSNQSKTVNGRGGV